MTENEKADEVSKLIDESLKRLSFEEALRLESAEKFPVVKLKDSAKKSTDMMTLDQVRTKRIVQIVLDPACTLCDGTGLVVRYYSDSERGLSEVVACDCVVRQIQRRR